MRNHYLIIEKTKDDITINSSDGVFSSYAHRANREEFCKYCDEEADKWINSKLGNYNGWSKKHRRFVANKWLAAKNLPEGEYNYYFNLQSKKDIFSEWVAKLAKELDVEYELTIK